MAFNMMWKPGSQAVAGIQGFGSANPALVIYLDLDSSAILPLSDPAEWPEFIRLLRQTRDGSDEVAVYLGRHATAKGDSDVHFRRR